MQSSELTKTTLNFTHLESYQPFGDGKCVVLWTGRQQATRVLFALTQLVGKFFRKSFCRDVIRQVGIREESGVFSEISDAVQSLLIYTQRRSEEIPG